MGLASNPVQGLRESESVSEREWARMRARTREPRRRERGLRGEKVNEREEREGETVLRRREGRSEGGR
jgi:hypothetical protein